ncbi:RBBP9/YdeN family alpha/beta hydrolase [Patescibacteria group bacterium]
MKAIIIHGWDQKPTDEWLPWLTEELKNNGWQVELPTMPNAAMPKLDEWMDKLVSLNPNKNTVLIGHSLSNSLILKYMERPDSKLKSAYLVAAWDYLLPALKKEHISFFKGGFDYEAINNKAPITILQSTDDPYLDFDKGRELAEKVNATFTPFENSGHFQTKDGYGEFPDLLEMIIKENR